MYKLIIDERYTDKGRLESLNEYIRLCRHNKYTANGCIQRDEKAVITAIRHQLRGLHLEAPVWLHYHFYEWNRLRDWDNVTGYAHKVIQDALVKAGVLVDDKPKFVVGFDDDFQYDKKNPRIEVEIEEISNE